jgi:hypothetical protein
MGAAAHHSGTMCSSMDGTIEQPELEDFELWLLWLFKD